MPLSSLAQFSTGAYTRASGFATWAARTRQRDATRSAKSRSVGHRRRGRVIVSDDYVADARLEGITAPERLVLTALRALADRVGEPSRLWVVGRREGLQGPEFERQHFDQFGRMAGALEGAEAALVMIDALESARAACSLGRLGEHGAQFADLGDLVGGVERVRCPRPKRAR